MRCCSNSTQAGTTNWLHIDLLFCWLHPKVGWGPFEIDTAIRLYIYIYTYIYIYMYIYIHMYVNLPGSVDFSLSNGAQLAAQAFCQSCPTCSRWWSWSPPRASSEAILQAGKDPRFLAYFWMKPFWMFVLFWSIPYSYTILTPVCKPFLKRPSQVWLGSIRNFPNLTEPPSHKLL